MIAHVVLFEPKAWLSEDARRAFLSSIRDVARNISQVTSARIGTVESLGVSPENKIGVKTYSYGAVFEFLTPEDLSAYLIHPRHSDLRKIFWELCESTLIADLRLVDVSSPEADALV